VTTEPSVILYWLPWHGQVIRELSTLPTVQPRWVQIALNALMSPAVGWVSTICWSLRILPPPTGIAETWARAVPLAPDAVLEPEAEEEEELLAVDDWPAEEVVEAPAAPGWLVVAEPE